MNECKNPAAYRYTWAGRDEARCCIEHAHQIAGVANAMGYHVQMIPLTIDEMLADDQCTSIEETP